ncbi:hypothetical protein [Nocardia sp. NPDC051570]|uniref:hypothetical protein n=1 Tax=Nocardia sp. NPDC051570 TaxID=3364324 RepID=UPI0037AC15B8
MERSLPQLGDEYGPWLIQEPHPAAVTARIRVDVDSACTEFVLSAVPLVPVGHAHWQIATRRTGFTRTGPDAGAMETAIG